MSRTRLISLLCTTSVLVGAALGSAPAYANDDTMAVAACVLEPASVAGVTAPGVASGLTDLAGINGWDPLNLLDTDNGTFRFSGTAVCGGADVAGDDATSGPGSTGLPDIVAGTYKIDAGAAIVGGFSEYSNLICGTGTANGDAVLTNLNAPAANIKAKFGITFAGGVGKLSMVIQPGGFATGQLGSVNAVDGGEGTGVIDIAPFNGNCANTDVTGFQVNGAFETSLSDNPGNSATG